MGLRSTSISILFITIPYIDFCDNKYDLYSRTINSLKNNYKINDLLKMNLSIYAIKVGTTTLSQLDVNKELDIDFYSRPKDNPDYTSSEKKTSDDDTDKNRKLDVYDVLLAGVETND